MAKLTKLQAGVVAFLAAALFLFVLVVAGYWVLSRAARDRSTAAEAKGAAIVAKGDTAASAAATAAVADLGDRQGQRQQLDQENRRDIESQAHASDAVDPGVHDAGIRSLCRRAAYRDAEQCSGLR